MPVLKKETALFKPFAAGCEKYLDPAHERIMGTPLERLVIPPLEVIAYHERLHFVAVVEALGLVARWDSEPHVSVARAISNAPWYQHALEIAIRQGSSETR